MPKSVIAADSPDKGLVTPTNVALGAFAGVSFAISAYMGRPGIGAAVAAAALGAAILKHTL